MGIFVFKKIDLYGITRHYQHFFSMISSKTISYLESDISLFNYMRVYLTEKQKTKHSFLAIFLTLTSFNRACLR